MRRALSITTICAALLASQVSVAAAEEGEPGGEAPPPVVLPLPSDLGLPACC